MSRNLAPVASMLLLLVAFAMGGCLGDPASSASGPMEDGSDGGSDGGQEGAPDAGTSPSDDGNATARGDRVRRAHGNTTVTVDVSRCTDAAGLGGSTGTQFTIPLEGPGRPKWANLTVTWQVDGPLDDRFRLQFNDFDGPAVTGSSPLEASFDVASVVVEGDELPFILWCAADPVGLYVLEDVDVAWTIDYLVPPSEAG